MFYLGPPRRVAAQLRLVHDLDSVAVLNRSFLVALGVTRVTPHDATLATAVVVVDLVVLVQRDVGAGARGQELALAADHTVARNRRLYRRLRLDPER